MIEDVCKELKNYFDKEIIFKSHTIKDGALTGIKIADGQYFRIAGSVFNDGVYQSPELNLKDETFEGGVWLMAVPPQVIRLAEEIKAWQEKNADIVDSPYQSESFGGYSYTKAPTDKTNWQTVFKDRLNRWRKI